MSAHAPSPLDIAHTIDALERRQLDGAIAPYLPIWGTLDTTCFLRVLGQARFWEQNAGAYPQCMTDAITGFHGTNLPFAYLLLGHKKGVAVYVGLQDMGAEPILRSSLQGTFPGIVLADQPEAGIGTSRKDSPIFRHIGRLTGIPTLKAGERRPPAASAHSDKESGEREAPESAEQIERLIRGLQGMEWGYFMRGIPYPDAQVVKLVRNGLNNIASAASQIKRQHNVQQQQQTSGAGSVSESWSNDETNRQAQYCTDLLEHNLQRLTAGKAQGMWQAEVYFFASEPAVLQKAQALLRAIFAGADSTPDPLRTFTCQAGASPKPEAFLTLLNSLELSALAQLPREEYAGYRVSDFARFDVDLPATVRANHATSIPIGKVLDGSRQTGDWFRLERDDFAKHALVVGVTGSGKTNTVLQLLDRLWNKGQGTPFLVIEPAKAEYRDLRSVPGFAALNVFTLGDERYAPFRLNPFEFEIASAENRVHVQTHIDYLKSVFNAAFILYAPMPYVLETCLHEIYEDKGWDLTTSQNRRLPPNLRGQESQWPVFPTLSDLYRKIDEAVDRLGYEQRIQMDVKAGLKARIGSLRLGGKGLMLDTQHGIPMGELLSKPAVLELERIGSDDEKAFVIGLILTRLYEYRQLQSRGGDKTVFRHLTVIEEAHRLLKNISTEVQTETANTKGQAVESFANMLSEIRAYGEGVLIAEQIPTKLAPDALKNTNLKILHRIVAEDDRRVMAGTMNLDESQTRFVSTLGRGQAVVYAEGADGSYLAEIPAYKDRTIQAHVSDSDIEKAMRGLRSTAPFLPLTALAKYLPADQLSSEVRDMVQDVLQHPEMAERFNRYFLSLVEEPRWAVFGYTDLLKLQERIVQPRPAQARAVALWVMLQAAADLLDERGRRWQWYYNSAAVLIDQLSEVLADIVVNFDNNAATLEELFRRNRDKLVLFQNSYQQLCAKAPLPFVGCVFCQAPCRYRFEVAQRLPASERDFTSTISQTKDDTAMWRKLAALSLDSARKIVQAQDAAVYTRVAICCAAQMGPRLGFHPDSQRKLVKNVVAVMTNTR